MPIQYEAVKQLWDLMLGLHGIVELAHFVEFEFENIREVFIKTKGVWNEDDFQVAMEMAQLLTILFNMTFQCQMSGESSITSLTTFVEMNGVAGAFVPSEPQPLRKELRTLFNENCREILKKEIKTGRGDLNKYFMSWERLVPMDLAMTFKAANKLLAQMESALS
ncbi:unnamed protein product [Durusdinium trenchii]|uniref:Uncharacterized protein n=1 Tax=Durusdinium trenchii TaxID=1381693 RepID=A0ABP0HMW8_9DINO